MITPVNRDKLRKALIDISALISNVEHFIFYGTLLGIVREGDIIEHDDDVDILVNLSDRDKLISIIEKSDFSIDFTRPFNAKSQYFLQIHQHVDDEIIFVDFYFYENDPSSDFIIDRWNFKGAVNTPSTALHIPKSLVYPITNYTFQGVDLYIPQCPKKLCEFLYGKNWHTPILKNAEYTIIIKDHKPVMVLKQNSSAQNNEEAIRISDLDDTGKAVASYYRKLENNIKKINDTLQELETDKAILRKIMRSHFNK